MVDALARRTAAHLLGSTAAWHAALGGADVGDSAAQDDTAVALVGVLGGGVGEAASQTACQTGLGGQAARLQVVLAEEDGPGVAFVRVAAQGRVHIRRLSRQVREGGVLVDGHTGVAAAGLGAVAGALPVAQAAVRHLGIESVAAVAGAAIAQSSIAKGIAYSPRRITG